MPERDECRPVALPSGEVIRVRGCGGLGPAGVAALAELVEAVRVKAAENPPDPGTGVLHERIEAARGPLNWRQVAALAGVGFSTLFRIGQGRMPGAADLARIETWLAVREDATNVDTSAPDATEPAEPLGLGDCGDD